MRAHEWRFTSHEDVAEMMAHHGILCRGCGARVRMSLRLASQSYGRQQIQEKLELEAAREFSADCEEVARIAACSAVHDS